MKAVGHDHGVRKVFAGDGAVGLGQIHDDDTHVLLARQTLQIAAKTRLRAPQHHIEHLVMSQIDQRGRIALLTAEGVFIDPQHLGATAARQLPDPLRDKGLIPTLNGGTANPVRARQLALTHAPIMGPEDLQAIRLGGPAPWPDACKAVAKVPIAGQELAGPGPDMNLPASLYPVNQYISDS